LTYRIIMRKLNFLSNLLLRKCWFRFFLCLKHLFWVFFV